MDLNPASFERFHVPVLLAFTAEYRRRYHLPFLLRHPGDCLIVGAGSGTDVGEALHSGATHVDAVDIDPVIVSLGSLYNPAHPYDDARVNVICDDARHYFNSK